MKVLILFRPGMLLLAAVLAFSGVGCGSGSDAGVTKELSPNQELRIRIAGDPTTLDPQLAAVAEEISIVKQLFRGLFAYDEGLDVVPALAREMPTKDNGGISGDGLTYRINLRRDATWSDGEPVTAHDFVYAFQRLFDPAAGGQGYYAGFYTAIEGAEAVLAGEAVPGSIGVSAPNDYSVQITLSHEQPTLPTLLALWPASPLREDLIDQYGEAWTEPGNIVTNGPFGLSENTPEQQIVLDANLSYWGDDDPTLQRLVYKVIPDDSAALIAYQNNEIDVTAIPDADAARFDGNAEQVRYAQLETFAVQYNNAEPPFDDALVRQAFSRAIDRDGYVRAVLNGVGASATSWLPPGMPGGDASIGSDLDFNPDAARALLGQAGYEDGDGFPTVTFTVPDDQSTRLTAEFLQAQLGEHLGIDVEIETLDENTFFERYGQGDFEFTFLSWFADYADPENWLPQQFGTDGAFNVIGYSNSQVDDFFEQAAGELNQEKRLALYDAAHRIIIADQAVTPVYYPERNYLVRSTVAGLVTTALDAEPGDWFVSSVQILQAGAPPASEP
jgi:oligopeptide transport system substrate-binding protein